MTEKKRKNTPVEALPEKNRTLYESFMFTDPVDLFVPDEVEKRTRQYIDYVNRFNIAPLWTDYAYCLGYNRIYLTSVMRGTSKTHHPIQTRQILERVHLWLEASLAQFGLQHPENTVMTIWLQKNNFDYHEPTVQVQVGSTAVIEERPRTLEEIMERNKFILESVVPADYVKPKKELEEV